MRNKLFAALVLLASLFQCLAETDALMDLKDSRLQAGQYTNRNVTIQPMSFPTVSSPSVVLPGRLYFTSDTNGQFWISNIYVGLYEAIVQAPPQQTIFKFLITATNLNSINVADNLVADSTATFPAGSVAWAAAVTDAKYARTPTNGGSGTFTGTFIGNGQGLTNITGIGTSNNWVGSFTGNGAGLTNLIALPNAITNNNAGLATLLGGVSSPGTNYQSEAFGRYAVATDQAQAFGYGAKATNSGANAFGLNAIAGGFGSVAFGYSGAFPDGSVAIGSAIVGPESTNSIAIGYAASANNSTNSVAIGWGAIVNYQPNTVMLGGTKNIVVTTPGIFSGNGSGLTNLIAAASALNTISNMNGVGTNTTLVDSNGRTRLSVGASGLQLGLDITNNAPTNAYFLVGISSPVIGSSAIPGYAYVSNFNASTVISTNFIGNGAGLTNLPIPVITILSNAINYGSPISSPGTNFQAEAFGKNSVVGIQGTAIGYGATATNGGYFAAGVGAIAGGFESVALGYSGAIADNSIAIGTSLVGHESTNSIAIGNSSSANNSTNSVAIGYGAIVNYQPNTIMLGGTKNIVVTTPGVFAGNGALLTNITAVVTNALTSAFSTNALNSTNFWGILNATNLPAGLSISNYVGTFTGNGLSLSNINSATTNTIWVQSGSSNSLYAALAIAKAGDTIRLNPGRINIGTNFIDLPNNVNLVGPGEIFSSTMLDVYGCTIVPGNYSFIDDVTVTCDTNSVWGVGAVGDGFWAAIGRNLSQKCFTNAVVRRMRVNNGSTDVIYLGGGTSSPCYLQVDGISGTFYWDWLSLQTTNGATGSIVTVNNATMSADGTNANHTVTFGQGEIVQNGYNSSDIPSGCAIVLDNCSISITNAAPSQFFNFQSGFLGTNRITIIGGNYSQSVPGTFGVIQAGWHGYFWFNGTNYVGDPLSGNGSQITGIVNAVNSTYSVNAKNSTNFFGQLSVTNLFSGTGAAAGTYLSGTGWTTPPGSGLASNAIANINGTGTNITFYSTNNVSATFTTNITVSGTNTSTVFVGNGAGITGLYASNVIGAISLATNAAFATNSTWASYSTNFLGLLSQSNLTIATLTNNISGIASFAGLATNSLNSTNFWGVLSPTNLPSSVLTNAESAYTTLNGGLTISNGLLVAGTNNGLIAVNDLSTNNIGYLGLVSNYAFQTTNSITGSWFGVSTNGHWKSVDQQGTAFYLTTNGSLSIIQTNGNYVVLTNGSIKYTGALSGNGAGFTNIPSTNLVGLIPDANLGGAATSLSLASGILAASPPVSNKNGIAEAYCQKMGVVSQTARNDIHYFISGLGALATNLVDFAWYSAGMNVSTGMPQAMFSKTVVVGNYSQCAGGISFSNNVSTGTTNWLYVTNLPPTPNGRTLIWWGNGSMNSSGITQDGNAGVVFLEGPQSWIPDPLQGIVFNSGAANGYAYNAVNGQDLGGLDNMYLPSGGTENSPYCGALISGPGTNSIAFLKRDWPYSVKFRVSTTPYNLTNSPAWALFGYYNAPSVNEAWPCLVRGWCYFNTVLTTNQVLAIDGYVKRVGLIIEGDSKSTPAQVPWAYWYLQQPSTYGLYSILTNSAVSGTASADALARLPSDLVFKTNSQYPIVIYSDRIGHNDFSNTNSATLAGIQTCYSNRFNMWAQARTNGDKVIAWTVDRTSVTWSGGSPGNSNLLELLNSEIKNASTNIDYLMDDESWYVANYGQTPFTNLALYNALDNVHDTAAAPLLGQLAASVCNQGIGYSFGGINGGLNATTLSGNVPDSSLGSAALTNRSNIFLNTQTLVHGISSLASNKLSVTTLVVTNTFHWTNTFTCNVIVGSSGNGFNVAVNESLWKTNCTGDSVILQPGEWMSWTNGSVSAVWKPF